MVPLVVVRADTKVFEDFSDSGVQSRPPGQRYLSLRDLTSVLACRRWYRAAWRQPGRVGSCGNDGRRLPDTTVIPTRTAGRVIAFEGIL